MTSSVSDLDLLGSVFVPLGYDPGDEVFILFSNSEFLPVFAQDERPMTCAIAVRYL